MTLLYKASAFALAILFHLPAIAQQESPSQKKDIEHVLVTVPIHRTNAETALPVTVLTGDDLRNNLSATIGETLASKPGLASASFGPSVGQPVIRGQQGARVMVLQNSTSSADASNISADHSVSVEPVLAEAIEVLRGPSTLLYGGGAIGGVVNVIDKRVPVVVPDQLTGSAELRHGSVNDETTAVIAINGGSGNTAFHFDALDRDSNDVEISGRAAHEAEETTEGYIANTDSKTKSYTFGISQVFDKGFIGIAVNRLDSEYGIPPGAHEHHHDEGEEEEEEEEEGPAAGRSCSDEECPNVEISNDK